jgi:hypothetical protein
VPGGVAIANQFEAFNAELPNIMNARNLDPVEVTFGDYTAIVVEYITAP